jgi:Major Facilitator Superfamily
MSGIVKPSGDIQPPLSASKTRMLLLGLALATGMEFYTFDSMNLVLVDITGTLGVSEDEASWLLTIYSCSLFLGVPVSIWAAGHFGYKRFLLATKVLFAVAAIGCSVSPTLKIMLFWRALQGAAADRKTLELSGRLYNRGVEDFFVVLDAERSLDSAEYELAGSDENTAVALVSLYKSLGGGWR